MALQSYATLKIFYDGEPMTQVTRIQHVINSGKNRVDLIETGLAGFTPGAGDCTISVGFAIPREGTEFDFKSDAANMVYRTIQLQEGERYYIGQGTLTDAESSQSSGANAEGSFNWTGELRPMEEG
jgi:hypothetical protein